MKRTLIILLTAIIAISPQVAKADPIEYIIGIIDPAVGVERVEFLPSGHLQKNKPRYITCKWQKNVTAFFEIFTCDMDEELVGFLIERADEVSKKFSDRTKFSKFDKKIKLYIYSSSRHFTETNLVFGLVPEGLGGSTEIIKRKRMVIAFRDSVEGFDRLLKHESAHRYHVELMNIKLFNLATRNLPPLWFVEGAAQHMAHSLDPRSALVMRDAYINGYLAHAHGPWHPILIYTQGEYTVHYIAEKYKHKGDVITDIFKECKNSDFPEAFQKVTGETLEEFDRHLQRHIEKEYFQIRSLDDLSDQAPTIDKGIVLAAKGQFFITKKNAHRWHDRYNLDLNWTDGHTVASKKLADSVRLKSVEIRGLPLEISPEFGFQEHGASFISTSTVLYAVDKGGKDVIVMQEFSFNEKKKKIKLGKKKVYDVKGVRDVQHPVMINEEEIAFVGRNEIFAEIYLLNTKSKQVRQLTSLRRTYRGLAYSHEHKLLVTSIENEESKSFDLAAYSLESGAMYLLTESPENESSVSVSSDGLSVLYISDKGLVHNIYRYDLGSRVASQLTNARIGFFRPQWFGDSGMIFNSFNQGALEIKTAPMPAKKNSQAVSAGKAVKTSQKAENKLAELRTKLPNADKITIFDMAISSDGTKALFLENRILSMEELARKDPQVRFHFVNSSTTAVKTFTLKKFRKLKDFEGAVILAGSQILLQKSQTYREKTEHTDPSGKTTYTEEEKVYKEAFIYDPATEELAKLDYEVWGDGFKLFRISPSRTHLLWANESKITVYDVVKKQEIQEFKGFSELKDAEFFSDTEIAALDKEWDVNLHYLVLGSTASKKWDITTKEERSSFDTIGWRPVKDDKKIFFLTTRYNEKPRYKVGVFDLELGTMTVVYPKISAILGERVENGKLLLETPNLYGLKRTIEIDGNAKVTERDQAALYQVKNTSSAINGFKRVTRRELRAKKHIERRLEKLSRFPLPYYGYGAAGVGIDNGGLRWYVAMDALFLDEMNDKLFWGNVYVHTNYGIATLIYQNQPTGMTYKLGYWNFDGRQQATDLIASKKINWDPITSPLKNWDVSIEERYMRTNYYGRTLDLWRTKVGSTYSIDTTVGDWHGPHSGTAFFSSAKAGLDEHSRYQGIDLNVDARHYLPFTERSGMAFRLTGGRGFGPNPTLFLWGGNKTFRGTKFDGQAGNTYVLHSSELRIPLIDAAGAKVSGPFGDFLQFFTVYMDIRGGMYYDIGDIWYDKNPPLHGLGHKGYQTQQSAGAFVNIPTIFGINVRFSQEIWWGRQFNFWLGYNW